MPVFILDLCTHARAAGLTMDVNDFRENIAGHVMEQLDATIEKTNRRFEYFDVGFVTRAADDAAALAALDALEAWIDTTRAADISAGYRVSDAAPQDPPKYRYLDNWIILLTSYRFYVQNKNEK